MDATSLGQARRRCPTRVTTRAGACRRQVGAVVARRFRRARRRPRAGDHPPGPAAAQHRGDARPGAFGSATSGGRTSPRQRRSRRRSTRRTSRRASGRPGCRWRSTSPPTTSTAWRCASCSGCTATPATSPTTTSPGSVPIDVSGGRARTGPMPLTRPGRAPSTAAAGGDRRGRRHPDPAADRRDRGMKTGAVLAGRYRLLRQLGEGAWASRGWPTTRTSTSTAR